MRSAIAGAVLLVLPWLSACPRASGPEQPPACDPSKERCVYSGTLSTLSLQPGEETDLVCQSWFLDNPQELLVTEVAMGNDGGYHHSNWFFVPVGSQDVPEGTWDCDEHGWNDFAAAMAGGFLYAQSTQSRHEVQRFPAGAAVRIPPYSVIIGDTHVSNETGEPLTTSMRLRLETAPRDQVSTLLVPARFSYFDLEIPPHSQATFTAECDLASATRAATGEPFEYELYYALPHYHHLGVRAELSVVGGPSDGMVLHRHEGYGTNFGRAFDPPIDLVELGATGLRFSCSYDNHTDRTVGHGIHGDEMCVFAVFADTNAAWDAQVPEGSGRVVRSGKGKAKAAGEPTVHTGPCEITALPWTENKPGGQPRPGHAG